MEFDISKAVEKIVMQVQENQEEFIFETIRPYCESILQMKINKEELKQILLIGMQRQKSDVLDKIKSEIKNEQNMDYKCHRKTYDNCLRIIDKYKIESGADMRGDADE